ncbi:protein-export membrane protein SecF [Candidatus Peribacteria bacterium RIFCSPHIGHO2_01_FULL_51_35]|nr:MAG: protein-export membrane protein SecF [Candidatus Peribacteria bacterium RIFCSPHIGHO2_01_FULL_51_35]
MSFLRLARIFLPVSLLLMAASVVMLITPGLRLGIEFTGGTLMEFSLPEGKDRDALIAALDSFENENVSLESATVSKTKTDSYFVRTESLTNEEHLALAAHVQKTLGEVKELQFTTIGPTVGASLKNRALYALIIAAIAIILYVAVAFRKVPRKLSPIRFGVIAVVALLHDIVITVGIFTVLSHVTTFQVDTLFVTALLSIMGYSVNDTIVIFDRIRDNLGLGEERHLSFADLAEKSLKQTMTRTLNTGLGALIMLFALFFLGSESIRWFILTLIFGTVIGTYSSFFIATPLLVYWKKKD